MRIEDYCLIFRFGVKSLFAGYRKESSLSKENFVFLPDLSLPPTTLQPKAALDIAHYGWK